MERPVPRYVPDLHEGNRSRVNGCEAQYENICKGEFAAIHAKLDRLDETIRGNGRPGIQVRLDRLEAAERSRSRLI